MTMPGTIDIPLALMGEDLGEAGISFPEFISGLQKVNPYALYERQLQDYYYQQIEALLKKKGKDIGEEDNDKDRLIKEYETQSKAAETLFEMGAPVSTLPFYDKVRGIYGLTVQAAYRDQVAALNEAFTTRLEARQAELTKLKMGAATPEGRRRLNEAVVTGAISEDNAYLNNPYWQTWYAEMIQTAREKQEADIEKGKADIEQLQAALMTTGGKLSPEGLVKVQQAIARGKITSEEAFENNPYWQRAQQIEFEASAEKNRISIAKGMRTHAGRQELLIAGLISEEQAYPSEEQTLASKAAELQAVNPGMSMEEARKVADVSSVGKMAQAQASQVMEPYRRWMAIAKQEGIDTNQYETNLPTGNLVEQLARAVSDTREGRKARQSALLAKQYPEGFRQYTQEFHKGFAGSAPLPGWEKGFQGWATATPQGTPGTDEYVALTPAQEAFQGSVRAQEEASLKKYGNIYQAYKTGFLGKLTDPNEYKPLEQWIQETPEAKVAWEEQERIRALSGPRPGRPIYARRR